MGLSLFSIIVNMEITIPCVLEALAVGEAGKGLISTAVLQCLCVCLYVQKFIVNSYREEKLNQHQIVAGSFKSVGLEQLVSTSSKGRVHFSSTKDAKVFL